MDGPAARHGHLVLSAQTLCSGAGTPYQRYVTRSATRGIYTTQRSTSRYVPIMNILNRVCAVR